jgi:hypothetical protein
MWNQWADVKKRHGADNTTSTLDPVFEAGPHLAHLPAFRVFGATMATGATSAAAATVASAAGDECDDEDPAADCCVWPLLVGLLAVRALSAPGVTGASTENEYVVSSPAPVAALRLPPPPPPPPLWIGASGPAEPRECACSRSACQRWVTMRLKATNMATATTSSRKRPDLPGDRGKPTREVLRARPPEAPP